MNRTPGWSGARTNGTLGNFTIYYTGDVEVKNDKWYFSGKMEFYDYWDFNTDNPDRPLYAQLKVLFANLFLPGKPFKISSEQVDILQNSQDSKAQWGAPDPQNVPDNGARSALDIGVGDILGGDMGGEAGAQASEDLNKKKK